MENSCPFCISDSEFIGWVWHESLGTLPKFECQEGHIWVGGVDDAQDEEEEEDYGYGDSNDTSLGT